jgi:hypothetical protein
MISGTPKTTYANGREARPFDIVEGKLDFVENSRNPFKAQVVRGLPKAGLAEIACIRRPGRMARRLPYFALQNLAAAATGGCGLMPRDELQLRSRASRPVAKYLKDALKPAPCTL